MNITKIGTTLRVGAFGLVMLLGFSGATAHADAIDVTYLGAGVTNPTSITSFYETFTSAPLGTNPSSFGTSFSGSGITGTYTGAFVIRAASQYGGAGGTGQFIAATPGSSYTLTLSSGVNYFGFWLSALDAGNQVQLYDGSSLLYTFSPQTLINSLGTCSADPAYCGMPSGTYAGQNSSQQYAYVNFYDATGSDITKIVYTETSAGGGASYESDNHAVANLSSAPGGTPLGQSPTPEPSSLLLMGTGLLASIPALRRIRPRTAR